MKNIKLFFITVLIVKSSLCFLCINSNFDDNLFNNSPQSFQVAPLKEMCYKYKLNEQKNSISLTFTIANSYTAEVLIYKSKNLIMMKDGKYYNYEEKYYIIENKFKDINVKDYYDYVYIIIHDSKEYYFYDNVILYDSELPIEMEENNPIDIANFMQNNKYIFTFSSNKNLQLIYSSSIAGQKILSVEYDENKIMEQQIDNKDIIINLKNENRENKLLKVVVENKEIYSNNKEFSLIVYEKDNQEFIEVKEEKLIKINYIKNNINQNFYFFSEISKYKSSSSINFKLDYNAKKNKYINIISDIVYSDKILNSEDYINIIPKENKLQYIYDSDSDEILKLYFNDKRSNNQYKYIIMQLEIKDFGEYYKPKYFTISLSKETEIIDLTNIQNYNIENININSIIDVPNYVKLNLLQNSYYIFTTKYQDHMTLIKGDLLTNSEINKNYIDNQKDIIILSDISELTIQISDIELINEKIYIEKILPEDVIIIENDRNDADIKIIMSDEYCRLSKKKYLLGSYNKEKYQSKDINTVKYWYSEDGEMELYYKNNLSIDNKSLFPSSSNYKHQQFTSFMLTSSIDLFSFSCTKPGTLYIKPLMKSFKDKTHIITQNSISYISLNTELEILQLTSPLKLPQNCGNILYLLIQTIQENNDVTLISDKEGVFQESIISGNKFLLEKIDINRYKSNDLAIKIISDGMADIEVIEIIHYDFSEYFEINNDKSNKINKNNFVKFVDKNVKKINVNIKGLNQVPISYTFTKLATKDINYIPLAYNFKDDVIKKDCGQNEIIEIENKFYGKNDGIKEYQAFIFSIQSSQMIYEYEVKIEEIGDSQNSLAITFVIILIILLLLILIFVFIRRRKKKNAINIESIDNGQSLYPNQKYILDDINSIND